MNARGEFRRSDWLAVAGGLLITAVILATGLFGRQSIEAARQAEIDAGTQQLLGSVAETVATDIGRALSYGIPLGEIYGLEPYLSAVVASNSEVAGIALLDPDRGVLATGGTLPAAAPSVEVPVLREDRVLALVKVSATERLSQAAARDRLLVLLATAMLAGLLAAAVLRLMLLEGTDLPLARLLASLRSVGRGRFADYTLHRRRGPVLELAAAVTRVIAPVRQGHRQLLAAAREITAVDLDHRSRPRLEDALQQVETTFRFSGGDRDRRMQAWAGWWLIAALLLGEAVRPLVGGFAADRAPGVAAEPLRVALVFLAQAGAAALGLLLAWRLRGGVIIAGLGLVISGLATLAVEWLYSGGLFLLTRSLASLGLAIGAGTLALSAGVRLRRPWLGLASLVAVLCCGPPLGSLLGELLGRRLAFATLGCGLLLLGALLTLAGRGVRQGRWNGPPGPRRIGLALGLAALPINGWLFGGLATFPLRYDYALMALLLVLAGAGALLASLPRRSLPAPLAVLLASTGPLLGLLGDGLPLLLAGALASGLGLGALWRGAGIATPVGALALLAAQGLGPALAALERGLALPFGCLPAAAGVLGALALLLPTGRSR